MCAAIREPIVPAPSTATLRICFIGIAPRRENHSTQQDYGMAPHPSNEVWLIFSVAGWPRKSVDPVLLKAKLDSLEGLSCEYVI
jgi:hypothetical protein